MTPSFFRSFFRRLPALLSLVAGVWFAGTTSAHAELRQHNLWWASESVTKNGHEIDSLLMFIFWLTLFAFVTTQAVYIWFIVKYRHRKGVKAVYSHGNNTLEIIWTTVPAMIFILLAVYSDKLWFQLRGKAPEDSLRLDIVAYQFGFHVRNPGADDKLANFDQLYTGESQKWMKKGENNFGVDPDHDDAAGHDDYQSENLLTIPVGRPVNVILRSEDVIHAFYVPEFRMYQDIVPGRTINWVWFTTEKTGHFALACNQLCGSGHYNMQAKIDVVTPEEYAKLVEKSSANAIKNYEEKQKEKAKAAAAAENKSASPVQVAAVNP